MPEYADWLSRLLSSRKARSAGQRSQQKIYLVSRSQYEVPLGHRVDEFEAPGLLEWFQSNWNTKSGNLLGRQNQPLVSPHSGFNEVIAAMQECPSKAPQTWSELCRFMEQVPSEGKISIGDNAIEACTDDDEIDQAWYLFDQSFAGRYPHRTSFLTHRNWQLPEDAVAQDLPLDCSKLRLDLDVHPRSPCCTYAAFLSATDGMTITGITGNCRFNGVLLPDLGEALTLESVPEKWPGELLLLRALLLETPGATFAEKLATVPPPRLNERLTAARHLEDFRSRENAPGFMAGDPGKCREDWQRLLSVIPADNPQNYWIHRPNPPLVQFTEHFCQIRFRQTTTPRDRPQDTPTEMTWAYLFFDSRWMAANPELAASLLKYGCGPRMLMEE